MILPPHEPCGRQAGGQLEPGSQTAVCITVRRFFPSGTEPKGATTYAHEDVPGCGRRFPLCMHGLRLCEACKDEVETPAAAAGKAA